jgi:hypothetical protein
LKVTCAAGLNKSALLYHESDKEAAKKRGGLVGYLRYIARVHPQSFVTLLGRVLPMQVRVETRTEPCTAHAPKLRRKWRARGVPLNAVAPLLIEARALESESDGDNSAS